MSIFGGGPVPATTAPRASADADQQGGGYLVPAGTSIGQIIDYYNGSGDGSAFEIYSVGLPMSRDIAVTFATLNRAVTLIAGAIGQLTATGGLYAVGRDGREAKSRRVRGVLERMSDSLDGGDSPALQTVEDMAADYCLDGNAISVPDWMRDGMLRKLTRMSAWASELTPTSDGGSVYRLQPVDAWGQGTILKARRDVVHQRWPQLLRHGRGGSTLDGFALGPVVALRPALDIGVQGDRYIREWFSSGARSKLHIDYGVSPTEGRSQILSPTQRQELAGEIGRLTTGTRKPLVTFGATSSYLRDIPQDKEALALREFQVQEVLRVYGIPAPLANVDMTSWGSGIEQLARVWWRFGLSQHLGRFLAPLSHLLLPHDVRFMVDETELLRGDWKDSTLLGNAIRGDAQRQPVGSVTEVRRILGLRPEVDGDLMEPMNGSSDPPNDGPPGSDPPGGGPVE